MKILNEIIFGDNLELFKEIPNESVNLVITSPPYYKQRDYGGGIGNEKSIEGYINDLLKVIHESIRITKKEGSIVFNVGDKYENGNLLLLPYRFAIEVLKNEPLKLVNDITWIKTNPTPRQFRRRLVNATEPFFHFVRSNDYYYNIDTFMNHLDMIKSKCNKNGPNIGKGYFSLIKKSSLSKEQKNLAKEELSKAIKEVKTGKIISFRMKIRGIHSLPFGGQEGGRKSQLLKKGFTIININGRPLKRDVITSSVETIKGCIHPAIYPEYIIKELLELLTRKDDIVLDPFMGSGTTAVVCKRLGRKYIGFDINPEYCDYARERLKNVVYQLSL